MSGWVAVILGAGEGRRMGSRAKAFLRVDGEPFAARIARTARAAGVERAVLVLAAPAPVEAPLPPGLEVARNPDAARGMLSSIQVGLRSEAARGAAGALIWPVDCPRVPATVVARLLEEQARTRAAVLIPTHGGRGGHPALVAAGVFPALLAASPDLPGGARAVLRAAASALRVEVPEREVMEDVDTPEDYGRL